MNKESQRIAIAEAVPNWRPSHGGTYCTHIESCLDDGRLPKGLFDPLNDLNAMNEAEKVLTDEQWFCYGQRLVMNHIGQEHGNINRTLIHASAAQRSEAFLRAIGKWDDSK